jgi:hypothetical protein
MRRDTGAQIRETASRKREHNRSNTHTQRHRHKHRHTHRLGQTKWRTHRRQLFGLCLGGSFGLFRLLPLSLLGLELILLFFLEFGETILLLLLQPLEFALLFALALLLARLDYFRIHILVALFLGRRGRRAQFAERLLQLERGARLDLEQLLLHALAVLLIDGRLALLPILEARVKQLGDADDANQTHEFEHAAGARAERADAVCARNVGLRGGSVGGRAGDSKRDEQRRPKEGNVGNQREGGDKVEVPKERVRVSARVEGRESLE